MSMCFAWWLADGYGPLQIVGDEKYRTTLALWNATNAKVEVRLRDIEKPDWTKSERCKCSVIETKHIDTTRYAVADKSPDPPPFYFTWEHLYKREELNLYPNCSSTNCPTCEQIDEQKAHGVLCKQIAQMWARLGREVGMFPDWPNDVTTLLAAPEICVLWMLAGDAEDKRVYTRLGEAASNIMKLRKAFYNRNEQFVSLTFRDLARMEEEFISKVFHILLGTGDQKTLGAMKLICAFCGKQMEKTWRCRACSCRYCSSECQLRHWPQHELHCPGRKKTPPHTPSRPRQHVQPPPKGRHTWEQMKKKKSFQLYPIEEESTQTSNSGEPRD